MTYELILPQDTQNEIREYVSERFTDLIEQVAALDAIVRELQKLAANPALGSVHYGGPFESRPIYQFSISVGDTVRVIQVAYKLHRDDGLLVVSGFRPIAL